MTVDIDRICFVSLPLYGYFEQSAYEQTGGGGAKRQLYLLSQELKNRFDVHAVVGDYGQPSRVVRSGVTLHRAYTPNERSLPLQFMQLVAAMRRANADIYVYRGNPRKGAAVFAAAALLNSAWVYNVASDAHIGERYDSCHPLIRWIFRTGLSQAHAVIAQTPYQSWELDRRFGVASSVVPNGYPACERVHESEDEYFLWVGRLDREQNRPHLFLDCAEAMPAEQFCIVGIPTDSDYYRRVIERARALSNVRFAESVPPDEMHDFYANALALVNTSMYEGFPNTFLEAWRCGTPVVSLEVNPGRYLDDVADTGYVDGDFESLVEVLRELAADSAKRETMGEKMKQYFTRHYQIEPLAKIYAAALESGTYGSSS